MNDEPWAGGAGGEISAMHLPMAFSFYLSNSGLKA